MDDSNLELSAKRKLDHLRQVGETLPPPAKTYSLEVDGKLLPIKRQDGKRVDGESGRQRKRRLKQERRELRGDD